MCSSTTCTRDVVVAKMLCRGGAAPKLSDSEELCLGLGFARRGKGGNDRYFSGLHLLLIVSASGVATGWTMASGKVQDRWLAELLLSPAGLTHLSGPRQEGGSLRLSAPVDWVGPVHSCGADHDKPIPTDLGYGDSDRRRHWQGNYGATVLTPPEYDHRSARRWFGSIRQVVETAFASLCDGVGLRFPPAHTLWGPLTRIAAKITAYNVGILLNRLGDRPDLAVATLIG